MALLTINQQQAIKPISPNWASACKLTGGVNNFNQLNYEVEELELKKLLGITFLQDIQNNSTLSKYATLLDGGNYINSSGETIYFKGLRYVLAFMNYSKYVGESFVSDSFTGMVKKSRDESESLSTADIRRLQDNAREIALQEWETIKGYINENSSIYPLFNACKTNKVYRPRLIGIKRTTL